MRWLLDSDFCIAYMRRGGERQARRLVGRPANAIGVPLAVYGELLLGAEKSNQPEQIRATTEKFVSLYTLVFPDRPIAAEYARIRAVLERRGTPIGSNDLWIAATALVHDAILITGNVSEFSRVDGLKIESWREPFSPRAD